LFCPFVCLITANPSAYGLTAAYATTIAVEVAAWFAVYAPPSKATKTAEAVAAKNTARVTTTAVIRTYAQAISNNPGGSSVNKTALGLNPKAVTDFTDSVAGNLFLGAIGRARFPGHQLAEPVGRRGNPFNATEVYGSSSPFIASAKSS